MYKQLTAIDLFSGAGGFSLAAHNCGLKVKAAIEFDKAAASTYQDNLIDKLKTQTKLIAGDINLVNIADLMSELDLGQGELDLLLGGPPCQGFSSHRLKGSGIDDPRNQLLIRYFDFVKELQPKAFLIENVSGLLWKRHEDYLDQFLALAKENDYQVKFCNTLLSKDYGVPQNRKRVFIYGVRKDIDKKGKFLFPPDPTHFNPQKGIPSWPTSSTVFEKPSQSVLQQYVTEYYMPEFGITKKEAKQLVKKLVFGKKLLKRDPCNYHMQHTDLLTERFKSTRLNGSRLDSGITLDCHKTHGGHKDVYGRIILHLPGNTITTGCNNPSKGRFVHPWLDHGMTLRHAARFQTFPDWFVFNGTTTEKAKQVGNAVPILLGEILINSIKQNIEAVLQLKAAI
ncbi:MAG: DNA cytosine methyltransferase [Oceanospirillaceae bacterium]|nr:DNA cytosine methyltransferase [Colwellia sp.]NQZ32644.1 DNA cytosine methyltransferase [Oceanospirillaceae bacterium]